MLFSFSAGQELSEHTASTRRSEVTVGADHVTATAGTWIHMPAHLTHHIRTCTPAVMLLSLFKSGAPTTASAPGSS